jgi:hypothetical protein
MQTLVRVSALVIAGLALTWFLLGAGKEQSLGESELVRPSSSPRESRDAAPTQTPSPSESRKSDGEAAQRAEPASQESNANAAPPEPTKKSAPPPGSLFKDELLADLGYPPGEIRFIRKQWEKTVEEEEALHERSPHKWVPHRERVAAIRESARADLGDEFYDAMLYAADQPNRARIGNVTPTSAAAAAGLTIKDVIISYDGERVFAPEDIKRLSEGVGAESQVELVIHRDSRDVRMFIQGGALGIRYFPGSGTPADY